MPSLTYTFRNGITEPVINTPIESDMTVYVSTPNGNDDRGLLGLWEENIYQRPSENFGADHPRPFPNRPSPTRINGEVSEEGVGALNVTDQIYSSSGSDAARSSNSPYMIPRPKSNLVQYADDHIRNPSGKGEDLLHDVVLAHAYSQALRYFLGREDLKRVSRDVEDLMVTWGWAKR